MSKTGAVVISTRKNGDRLIGGRGDARAQERYDAGTPPMHGLAAKPAPSARVAHVVIGSSLKVERRGTHWVALDEEGELGRLRWTAALDGKRHAVSGKVIRLPDRGDLSVERLVVSPGGVVKDFQGFVSPT